ncbi:uncharacterized protein MYCFIDRAFT_175017 [Pseudocercospora fijiensis CIRAD86]|uniref:Uncharacterized protein n=1 Tax=Pseudocercospora fijiensis (strain CIRAD86) TaxID=383855 RepID=M3B2J8_PSEFD|nr:uncharacterized protein MYCFIDRAFT_175017 [Pseudocercospora fijiensis CIRAD86]EME83593.1 hypothetical protein MYCFIDRAFT_175017 [Pseudocercospora fijiensis CIRAD86]
MIRSQPLDSTRTTHPPTLPFALEGETSNRSRASETIRQQPAEKKHMASSLRLEDRSALKTMDDGAMAVHADSTISHHLDWRKRKQESDLTPTEANVAEARERKDVGWKEFVQRRDFSSASFRQFQELHSKESRTLMLSHIFFSIRKIESATMLLAIRSAVESRHGCVCMTGSGNRSTRRSQYRACVKTRGRNPRSKDIAARGRQLVGFIRLGTCLHLTCPSGGNPQPCCSSLIGILGPCRSQLISRYSLFHDPRDRSSGRLWVKYCTSAPPERNRMHGLGTKICFLNGAANDGSWIASCGAAIMLESLCGVPCSSDKLFDAISSHQFFMQGSRRCTDSDSRTSVIPDVVETLLPTPTYIHTRCHHLINSFFTLPDLRGLTYICIRTAHPNAHRRADLGTAESSAPRDAARHGSAYEDEAGIIFYRVGIRLSQPCELIVFRRRSIECGNRDHEKPASAEAGVSIMIRGQIHDVQHGLSHRGWLRKRCHHHHPSRRFQLGVVANDMAFIMDVLDSMMFDRYNPVDSSEHFRISSGTANELPPQGLNGKILHLVWIFGGQGNQMMRQHVKGAEVEPHLILRWLRQLLSSSLKPSGQLLEHMDSFVMLQPFRALVIEVSLDLRCHMRRGEDLPVARTNVDDDSTLHSTSLQSQPLINTSTSSAERAQDLGEYFHTRSLKSKEQTGRGLVLDSSPDPKTEFAGSANLPLIARRLSETMSRVVETSDLETANANCLIIRRKKCCQSLELCWCSGDDLQAKLVYSKRFLASCNRCFFLGGLMSNTCEPLDSVHKPCGEQCPNILISPGKEAAGDMIVRERGMSSEALMSPLAKSQLRELICSLPSTGFSEYMVNHLYAYTTSPSHADCVQIAVSCPYCLSVKSSSPSSRCMAPLLRLYASTSSCYLLPSRIRHGEGKSSGDARRRLHNDTYGMAETEALLRAFFPVWYISRGLNGVAEVP